MRLLAVLFLSFTASVAQAVVIDFEEFSVGDSAPSAFDPLVSKGFNIWSAETPAPTPMSIITGTNGTNALGGSISGPGQDGFGYKVSISIELQNGAAFAVHGFDLESSTDPDGFVTIRGYLAAGGIADLSDPVGTGDWLLLDRIEFETEGNQWGPGFASLELDNFTATVVPVPAAVWLFGSALVGLGWVRRRKTA